MKDGPSIRINKFSRGYTGGVAQVGLHRWGCTGTSGLGLSVFVMPDGEDRNPQDGAINPGYISTCKKISRVIIGFLV